MKPAPSAPEKERHILIVTSGPLCRNPRALKESTTLAAAGYTVTALTVFHNEACAEMDRQLLSGSTVRQMAVGSPTYPAGQFRQRVRTWVARKLVNYLGWPAPSALGPVGPLLKQARQIPADLTVVHNEAPFWVGCRLLKAGRIVAADFEDWHSEDLLPAARKTRPLTLIRALEKQLLHEAVYCTTTSSALAKALSDAYRGPVAQVIPNCFELQAAPANRPRRVPELVWFSQTTGPGRGLEEFITRWGQLPPSCGRVTFIGSLIPGFDRTLLDLAPADARPRMVFLPPVLPHELPSVLTQFDAGLALEHRIPPNKDLTTSNKIFQYLNAGLAVIATPTAGQMEIMNHAPDAGIVVDLTSPDATSSLQAFLSDPGRISSAQGAARRAAETLYHWEKYAPRLVELADRATRRPA
jgi:glycosyltransferase involved in cell wall biosynthesis